VAAGNRQPMGDITTFPKEQAELNALKRSDFN
jgi:hypothetical protein